MTLTALQNQVRKVSGFLFRAAEAELAKHILKRYRTVYRFKGHANFRAQIPSEKQGAGKKKISTNGHTDLWRTFFLVLYRLTLLARHHFQLKNF